MHLTFFQRKRQIDTDIDITMGENNIFDKRIAMDGNSGLTDKSDTLLTF